MSRPPIAAPRPQLVLDTNAVLDWLLFEDPAAAALGRAITAGALRWIATSAMRDECFAVLARPALARWAPDPTALGRAWAAHCVLRPEPPAAVPAIRCADPDDQIFVDLALGEGAAWLVSRDRALLRLAGRLAPHGIVVTTPAGWAAAGGLSG